MFFWKKRSSRKNKNSAATRLRFEQLEKKLLLAIVWKNEVDQNGSFDSNNGFAAQYQSSVDLARAIVKRAIDDWNAVILDQNFDNDGDPLTGEYQLNVFAADLGGGERGTTAPPTLTNGIPSATSITLDDNGGGLGWFFDQTPLDDAEFTAIVNSGSAGTGSAFQASFIDATTVGQQHINDFYRTITHEIGHALGIFINGLQLDSGNFPFFNASLNPIQNPFPANNVDPLLGQMSYVGFDQVNSLRLVANPDGLPNSGDEVYAVNELWKYTLSSGATVTFTENGGAHFYEGSINGNTPSATAHPYDLMNAGRTIPAGQPNLTPPVETTRQWISDLDAQFLADAYGYQIVLPSTLNSAHVTLDSLTGTLLIQGGVTAQGYGQNDTFDIDVVGSEIVVQVNNTTEKVPLASVSQIVLASNGGFDTYNSFTLPAGVPYYGVQYVVSTNQDSTNAGPVADGLVDIDAVVPGRQTALRAAIIDADGFSVGTARGVYVPRGRYQLNIQGSGDTLGDLDVNKTLTVVGTGPGETIIDATPMRSTTPDRIFDVASGATLTVASVTLTGGKVVGNAGGAIRVNDGGTLNLKRSAVVGNEVAGTGPVGGGIVFAPTGGGTITDSVIAGNISSGWGGGIFLGNNPPASPPATVTMAKSIVANNSAANGPPYDIHSNCRGITTLGGNRVESTDSTFVASGTGDYIGAVDYVVTGIGDTYDHSDDVSVMSIRDAIDLANTTTGAQEIWLPAWHFLLTRDRETYKPLGSSTDTSIEFGDLDIGDSLTIRAVNGASKVTWRADLPADRVFELLGDYNGNNSVDTADYVTWLATLGSTTNLAADGDDNGTVEQADYYVWTGHYGNTLTLLGIQINGLP